ncbi:MAG: hypothetical protein QM687_15690 [Ferruginibacter sp.]
MNPLFKTPVVLISMAACIFFTIVMKIQGRPLQTTASPKGIVSLELAYQPADAAAITTHWNATNNRNRSLTNVALYNTLIDFVYIAAYGLFCILLCLRSAALLPEKKLLKAAAFLAFIAGGMDALENMLMLYTLQKEVLPLVTAMTAIAAGIKFSLLATVVLILLFAWLKRLFTQPKVQN